MTLDQDPDVLVEVIGVERVDDAVDVRLDAEAGGVLERREQAIQDLIDELRAAADVEENLDLLSEVQIDLPEGDSPTVTNPQLGAEPSGALRPTAPTGPRPPAPTKQGPTKQGGR